MNTEASPAHTPTPWAVFNLEGAKPGNITIRSEKLTRIADLTPHFGDSAREETTEANAALIVRAVNSHEELVGALESVCEDYDDTGCEDGGVIGGHTVEKARAALARAKGVQS